MEIMYKLTGASKPAPMVERDTAPVSPALKATRPFAELVNQRTGPLLQVVVYPEPMVEEQHREWHVELMAASPPLAVPAIRMAMQQPEA